MQLFENQAKQAHTAFIQPGAEVEANVPAVTSQTPQAQPVSPTQQHSLQPSGRTGAVQKSQNVSSAPTSRGSSELEQQVFKKHCITTLLIGQL